MAMEMEMRTEEEIEKGEDITPPLNPLSFSLHDPFLSSHCSSCFSPLPPTPSLPSISPLLYCSPQCSIPNSSFPFFPSLPSPSADLRASLRLLHLLQSHPSAWDPGPPERIFGLLTNREKLLPSPSDNSDDYDEEFFTRVRDGAKALAWVRGTDGVLEETVLCLVLTNAVDVQDSTGRTLGIAVYGHDFCWINHSCSPNACYRFLLSSPTEVLPDCMNTSFRILPGYHRVSDGKESSQIENGVCTNSCNLMIQNVFGFDEECQIYGPRIVVRSIKRIRKGEEVTVAYTDLLQPKAIRQSELWSRYRFVCWCDRCSEFSPSYVDQSLQEISIANLGLSGSTSDINFHRDNAIRRLTDYTDDVITEYLSVGDPKTCCEKLENMLTLGFHEDQSKDKEGKSPPTSRLHPLNILSLNSYTALTSAYKVRSSELLALYPETDEQIFQAFEMNRTSAAYSLLLASATHHLFQSEPSLIASAANFWIGAGESLLTLARSSSWNNFMKSVFPISNVSCVAKKICSRCSWVDKFSANSFHIQSLRAELQEVSNELVSCVANMSRHVWSFLAHNCHYLRIFKDPFDFNWPVITRYSAEQDAKARYNHVDMEVREHFDNPVRISIFQLGVHCLLYGSYLARIYYAENSHLDDHIRNILYTETEGSNVQ